MSKRKLTESQINALAIVAATKAIASKDGEFYNNQRAALDKLREDWKKACIKQLSKTVKGGRMLDYHDKSKPITIERNWDDNSLLRIRIPTEWGNVSFNIKPNKTINNIKDKISEIESRTRKPFKVMRMNGSPQQGNLSYSLNKIFQSGTAESIKARGSILRIINGLLDSHGNILANTARPIKKSES